MHRLPASLKLGLAVSIILFVISIPTTKPVLLAIPAAGVLLHMALTRLGPGFFLRRLLMLEPFALGIAGLALFQRDGLRLMAFLLARSTLCLAALILFSSTTTFSDGLSLLRRLRVPAMLVTTLALMHRYLHVLVDEALRMRRARASRTFTPARWFAWRTLASVAGQLFVRSVDRAERVYAAMVARGWQ